MDREQTPHRRSIRLQDYDYTSSGVYFITICTHQKASLLGEIKEGAFIESRMGILLRTEWLRLPTRFPSIELDAWVRMPNHLHGILILNSIDHPGTRVNYGLNDIETQPRVLPVVPQPTPEQFSHPIPGSIPTIIRSFKSSVTTRAKLLSIYPGYPIWQRGYYEHIIRNQADWNRIRDYIECNPANWSKDSLHP